MGMNPFIWVSAEFILYFIFFNIQRAVEMGYWVGSWPGQRFVPCGHLRALAKPLEFDPDWNAVISPPAKTVFCSKPGDGERVYSLLPSPARIFHFPLGSMPSHRCFHGGTLGKYSVCLFVFLNLKKKFLPWYFPSVCDETRHVELNSTYLGSCRTSGT